MSILINKDTGAPIQEYKVTGGGLGLKDIYGEPTNQTYAFDLLLGVKTQIDYFIQGYTQPLRDAVSASTKPYLTIGIKEAVIEQLTF